MMLRRRPVSSCFTSLWVTMSMLSKGPDSGASLKLVHCGVPYVSGLLQIIARHFLRNEAGFCPLGCLVIFASGLPLITIPGSKLESGRAQPAFELAGAEHIVLPGASGFDVECLDADPAKQVIATNSGPLSERMYSGGPCVTKRLAKQWVASSDLSRLATTTPGTGA
jgi:hypothetical protein